MTTLFNRKVLFEVGTGKVNDSLLFSSELRIEFEIEKTRESNANLGRVAIFNLSPDSIRYALNEGKRYILRAGYEGLNESPLLGIISNGDIVNVSTKQDGTDRVTSFQLSEDGVALMEKYIEKSYAPGVSVKTVIDDLGAGLGVAKGAIIGLKDMVFNGGYSASGKIKDRLNEICEKQDLEWSIQNGKIQILKKNGSNQSEVYYLASDTGLLKVWRENVKAEGTNVRTNIIKFNSLLIPDLEIGRKVEIASKFDINGVFTLTKIKFRGNNKDGEFGCECEAI